MSPTATSPSSTRRAASRPSSRRSCSLLVRHLVPRDPGAMRRHARPRDRSAPPAVADAPPRRHRRQTPRTAAPLLGPVVVARYDLWPAALVAWALVALEAARVQVSGALVGAAVAAKLYPLAVLPALAAHASERSRASLRRLFVPLAAMLGALSLGFVLVAPGGVAFGLSRQLGRGLQLESVGSSLVLVVRWFGVSDPGVEFTSGSQTLTGHVAQWTSFVVSLGGFALLAAFGVAVWRLRERVLDLRLSCATLVALVVVTSKVSRPSSSWADPARPRRGDELVGVDRGAARRRLRAHAAALPVPLRGVGRVPPGPRGAARPAERAARRRGAHARGTARRRLQGRAGALEPPAPPVPTLLAAAQSGATARRAG